MPSTLASQVSDVNVILGMGNVPEVLYGADAINQDIANCLAIAPGERWWWPNFAVDLRRYLFRLITPLLVGSLQDDIKQVLSFFMPYLTTDVRVTADLPNKAYQIVIRWSYNNRVLGTFNTNLSTVRPTNMST